MNNVLVVDDNIPLAESVCEIFEDIGYTVSLAYDGVEGWDYIQRQTPDLIVADINLPKINGYELLERVRSYQASETTPFIFLTARTDRSDWRRGMALGADDYLTKPFTVDEILDSVNVTISKRKKLIANHESTMTLLRRNITYALPHELRTPLQTIVGYTDLMQMDYQTLSPGDIKLMSSQIAQASGRLERIIENTLAYAQIELIGSDKRQQQQLRNNILPNASEVIEYSSKLIADKRKRANDLNLQINNCVLRMSTENLSRIIEELVDNAFKFSETGTSVTVSAVKQSEDYLILIHDRGLGISTKQQQQIGPYMQFDRLMNEQQGCGLGLTIAKRLVELHNGTFHIRSIVGDGTLITIKLPCN